MSILSDIEVVARLAEIGVPDVQPASAAAFFGALTTAAGVGGQTKALVVPQGSLFVATQGSADSFPKDASTNQPLWGMRQNNPHFADLILCTVTHQELQQPATTLLRNFLGDILYVFDEGSSTVSLTLNTNYVRPGLAALSVYVLLTFKGFLVPASAAQNIKPYSFGLLGFN